MTKAQTPIQRFLSKIKNLICKKIGHKDRRVIIDGDDVHLSSPCFLRVRICDRCKRWELMSKEENRFGIINWGVY